MVLLFGGVGFGEIALPIGQAQVLACLRIDDFDLDFAVRAVAILVGRRVGDEVLRAQLFLYLCEGGAQVLFVAWEEGTPARALGYFFQRALFDAPKYSSPMPML